MDTYITSYYPLLSHDIRIKKSNIRIRRVIFLVGPLIVVFGKWQLLIIRMCHIYPLFFAHKNPNFKLSTCGLLEVSLCAMKATYLAGFLESVNKELFTIFIFLVSCFFFSLFPISCVCTDEMKWIGKLFFHTSLLLL